MPWPPKSVRKPQFSWTFHGDNKADPKRLNWTPGERVRVSFEMPFPNQDFMGRGDTFSPPMIELSIYPLVAAVVAHWGLFETRMDEVLSAFVSADADAADQGWERRNFTKRKELLRTKASKRFPGPIADEIRTILEAAAVYHWQRNLIVHGHYIAQFDHGAAFTCAIGRVNKRLVSLPLQAAHLERMYHEIAFLTGRLQEMVSKDPTEKQYRVALAHRLLLRHFIEKYERTPLKPGRIKPSHPADRLIIPPWPFRKGWRWPSS